MVDFKGLADKAKDLLSSNVEKVNEAVDKVGEVIDEKTGGKYSAVVDKAQEAAKGVIKGQTEKDGDEAE